MVMTSSICLLLSVCLLMPIAISAGPNPGINGTVRYPGGEAAIVGGLWPGARVPYIIDDTVGAETEQKLRSAIYRLQKVSCVRFQQIYDRNAIHLLFESNEEHGRCRAETGYRGKPGQYANFVESCSEGSVIHETLHSLGFLHEQSRPDRDEYLIVHLEGIQKSKLHNFDKSAEGSTTDYGILYNYESIMHYSRRTGFEKPDYNGNSMDVRPGHPKALGNENNMGQRSTITWGDIQMLNARYECPKPWNKADPGSRVVGGEEEYEWGYPGEDCEPPNIHLWAGHGGPPDTVSNCVIECQTFCRAA